MRSLVLRTISFRLCTRRSKKLIRRSSLLFVPALLGASTFYVSPGGADSAPGTYAQPFRSVSKGIASAAPGDTIILKDGTYPADTVYGGGSTKGHLLRISKSGAPGSPITLKAENKQRAILDCGNNNGQPQTGCAGYISLEGAAYWVFQDLVFQRAYGIAMIMNTSNPAHDITVKGCRFEEIGRHVDTGQYGLDAIYANRGTYNLVFDGNTFLNIGRLPGSTNMSLDHAVYLHTSNAKIVNNVFAGSITGWGVQTAVGFSGQIANNTFAFTGTNTGGQIMLWDGASGGVSVQNNIFYQPNKGYAVNTCGLTAPSCSIDRNLVYGGTIGGGPGCGGSSGVCAVSNTLIADPLLVNPTSAPYDFRLLGSSAAIDKGAAISGLTTDAEGIARPQGNGHDLGAHEYASAAAPVISAVTAANITSNAATITWTTDKPATSQVQYGTSGYTNSTAADPSLVIQHTATLTNLAPGTTYQYVVRSQDANRMLTTSSNFTFVTAQAPAAPSFAFSLSASPSAVSTAAGQSVTSRIAAALASGSPQTVTFSAAGLPSQVTASFSPQSCMLPCSSTLTFTALSGAAPGTYGVTVQGAAGSNASTSVSLAIAAPVSGAVALWSLDEGVGTNINDASGNRNSGVLSGGATWASGPSSPVVSLNGSGAYIDFAESPSLQVRSGMTVSFWIRATDVPGVDERIVSKNFDWDVKLNGGNRNPQFSSGGYYAQLNYSLPAGSWQHVVFTFSNGIVTGYVNGAQQGTIANTFRSNYSLPASGYGLHVGCDASNGNFAKGLIDDVRIYNRPLAASEVAGIYSQTRH